jgi:hypothetical protein
MAVVLVTSVAFVTPHRYPANLLVWGRGYKIRDYAKVGFLLTLITFAVILFFPAKILAARIKENSIEIPAQPSFGFSLFAIITAISTV